MGNLENVVLLSKDKECLRSLQRIMRKCSAKVHTFDSEEELITFIRHNTVDIVIMSMEVDKNDSPICEAIRAIQKELPIILISDKSGLGDYSLYFKGVDTMSKPIDAEVLMRKVHLYKTISEAQLTLENISFNRRAND